MYMQAWVQTLVTNAFQTLQHCIKSFDIYACSRHIYMYL